MVNLLHMWLWDMTVDSIRNYSLFLLIFFSICFLHKSSVCLFIIMHFSKWLKKNEHHMMTRTRSYSLEQIQCVSMCQGLWLPLPAQSHSWCPSCDRSFILTDVNVVFFVWISIPYSHPTCLLSFILISSKCVSAHILGS